MASVAHNSGNPSFIFLLFRLHAYFLLPYTRDILLLLCYQAVQLTHILDERMKELSEDVEREKALKDVVEDTAKEEGKAVDATEKRAQTAKKARLVAEKKLAEVEAKLGGIKIKLTEAESLTMAQADEIADLKAALDASEDKGYNLGFADVENSVKPIVHQARNHGFGKRWLAALQAMGVAKDSPLRNPKQIPYPAPTPPIQSQVNAVNEEETLSMRELVHAIDTHVDMVDLEVTSNLQATEDGQGRSLAANQPTENAPTDEVIQLPPNDPFVSICFYFLLMFN